MTAITQTDIDLIKQNNKKVRMRVALLNDYGIEIENITGKIVPSPSYEIDAESDIRRTCSLSLSVENKEQIELDFENTWNKRMVELKLGIWSNNNQDYVWYSLGRMLMSGGSTSYSATEQKVNLNLVDLMACMTSERGNQIGTPIKIPVDSVVADVITAFVSEYADFHRDIEVCDFSDVIPYDIVTDVGQYPIEVLKTILDLFPYYEMFYDTDGTFTVQKIPTKVDDPIDIEHDIIDPLLISESRTVDFSQVKNTTEIWGAEISGDYLLASCTQDNGVYMGVVDDAFNTLESGATFTVIPNANNVNGQYLQIQDTDPCPIVNMYDGTAAYRYNSETKKLIINQYTMQGSDSIFHIDKTNSKKLDIDNSIFEISVKQHELYTDNIIGDNEVVDHVLNFNTLSDVANVTSHTLNLAHDEDDLVKVENGKLIFHNKSEQEQEVIYSPITPGEMQAGTGYVLRYFNGMFVLEGELLIRVIVQEIDAEEGELSEVAKQAYMQKNACTNVKWVYNKGNPLACSINPVTGMIEREKRQVFNDGDYTKIYSKSLAYERAYYENWSKCRMMDTVSIEMIIVPWMNVNDKIEYTSPVTGDLGVWLVKSISYNFQNFTMTVNASRFYNSDPWES